jgi:hypothetical protein
LGAAVPVLVVVDGLAVVAGFLAGEFCVLVEDVCAMALPASKAPTAKKVRTTIKGFFMLLLSHWGQKQRKSTLDFIAPWDGFTATVLLPKFGLATTFQAFASVKSCDF